MDSREVLKVISEEVLGTSSFNFKEFSDGNNEVYSLESDSGSCVVKFPEDGERSEREAYILNYLSGKGFPVPEVLVFEELGKISREFPADIQGRKVLVMEHVGTTNLMQEYERLWREAGAILAKLHRIEFSAQGVIQPGGVSELDDLEYCKHKLSELPSDTWLTEEKKEKLLRMIGSSRKARFAHYDYQPFQVMINNGRISGILDWEFARAIPPAHDLAKTETLNQVFQGNFKALKEGYRDERDLPENYEERKHAYKIVSAVELFEAFEKGTELYSRTSKILEQSIRKL
ncbi:MAG: phosphotransferase family protein [Candidatus Nanohalobium sp.]